jgi:hypothetical protein
MADGLRLFGFTIQRSKEEQDRPLDKTPTLAIPRNDDGAAVVSTGGAYQQAITLDPTSIMGNEVELINQYRSMSLQAECSEAIDSIVNEAIIHDESANEVIRLNLDRVEIDDGVKEAIYDEFKYLGELLDFKSKAHEIFRQWYVDGRLFFQVIVDNENPGEGIQELQPIDPRTIKKVVELEIGLDQQTRTQIVKSKKEYFIYNPLGISVTPTYSIGSVGALNAQGTQIAPDSILYVHSGTFDTSHTVVLSNLHKAIKPLNQLVNIEDALVIYRLVRAPERRIFYIDVGGMPTQKANEYLTAIMAKFKNKIQYDSRTGEMSSSPRFSTMLEDYYLPRREGGKATEITTLAGGQNLGQTEDIEYFKRKLYRSLNIPVSRIDPASGSNNGGQGMAGKATEITRDEVKFGRFLDRLRRKFADIFYQLLRRQLILKGIITPDDWTIISEQLTIEFPTDNYFSELKELEIMKARLEVTTLTDPYIGKYFSGQFVQKQILKLSEEEMEQMQEDMAAEAPDLEAEQNDQFDQELELQKAGTPEEYHNYDMSSGPEMGGADPAGLPPGKPGGKPVGGQAPVGKGQPDPAMVKLQTNIQAVKSKFGAGKTGKPGDVKKPGKKPPFSK